MPSGAHAEGSSSSSSGGSLQKYEDKADKFSISIPADWEAAEGAAAGNTKYSGAAGSRRTLAWFPPGGNPNNLNVTIVITNVGADYTSLGSFGNATTFGSNLVNSMDRSFLLRAPEWSRGKDPIQVARLVDAKETGGEYFIEYTVKKGEEPQRHLLSLLALGNNGRYNRLYTLTAQTTEEAFDKQRSVLLSVLASFKPPFGSV